jgi:predicted dehydrogenase
MNLNHNQKDSSPEIPNENIVDQKSFSRRLFINTLGLGAVALGLQQAGCSAQKKVSSNVVLPKIAGFEKAIDTEDVHAGWKPVSNRKIRVGLVGYGLSRFSAAFGFQDHPNVEIVAVSDIIPERCAELAKAVKCSKTYPSLEELVKDDNIEAVYVATDAPSHARHAIEVLKHGKHVAVAVPAIFGSLEEADELYNWVKKSGKKYMMFETSYYREDNHAMREINKAGGFGQVVYSEGEYLHYGATALPSYKGWRDGSPPMFYLTHATAYHIGVTGGTFTEVISCVGEPSTLPYLQGGKNRYNNPYGTQIALFKTSDGAISRMLYSKDTPGLGSEEGRIRGDQGSYTRQGKYEGKLKALPNLKRPPLPPGMASGSHGGSHGHLTEEFIRAILEDRQPLIDIATALNLSAPGIVAHQACVKGVSMKIPQYKMW